MTEAGQSQSPGHVPCVVLFDLDETLVYVEQRRHGSFSEQTRELESFDFTIDSDPPEDYTAFVRPFARQLLQHCLDMGYTIGVFTASDRIYGEHIVNKIFPIRPLYCFFRNSCGAGGLKDLRRLSPPLPLLSRVILIDNLAPANVVPKENGVFCFEFAPSDIVPWDQMQHDQVLDTFRHIIDRIVASDDVTIIVPRINAMFQRT